MIDHRHVLDAANSALKAEALAFQERADPTALGFLGKRIEPPGNIRRGRRRLLRVAENVRVEHPKNGGLLDDLPVVAAVQPGKDVADAARLFDESAQVLAGPLDPGRRTQYRLLKAARDEVVLKRPLVLEILLGFASRDLVERRLRDEEMAAVDDLTHLPIE